MGTRQKRSATGIQVPSIEEVAAEHAQLIRGALRRFHVEPADLDDVAQTVLLATSRRLATFDPALSTDPPRAILGLLVVICERCAAQHRRSIGRQRRALVPTVDSEEAAEVEDSALDPEARMIVKQRQALLIELLAVIPADRRAVISAHDLEGAAMTEIAAGLGVLVNTCWTRRHLAMADLRAAWRRRGGGTR